MKFLQQLLEKDLTHIGDNSEEQLSEASASTKPWQIRLRLNGEDDIVADNVMPADLNSVLDKLVKKYKVDRSEFEMFRHGTRSYKSANAPVQESVKLTEATQLGPHEREELLKMLYDVGYTYPPKTLERRLGLLNKAQMNRVTSKFRIAKRHKDEIDDLVQDIDDIIANEAEKQNDKWP